MELVETTKPIETLGHEIYDDMSKWTTAGIWKPPDFDVRGYQKAINKIVGVRPNGEPIIRLVWGWEPKKWAYTKWDEFGNAQEGEWRQKYCYLTVELDDGDYFDLSPPRWMLEEAYEPGQYAHSWESSRYVHDATQCRRCANQAMGLMEQSTSCVRRDVFGPAPRDGWYNLLPSIGIIAEHEHGMQCCDRRWADTKEICYGRYAIPSHRELDRIQRAVKLRSEDKETNPQAPLDDWALEKARLWGMQQSNEIRIAKRNELKEQLRDEGRIHGPEIVPPDLLKVLKESGRRVPTELTRFT